MTEKQMLLTSDAQERFGETSTASLEVVRHMQGNLYAD